MKSRRIIVKSVAVLTVRQHLRPVSEEIIGYHFILAVPNKARYCMYSGTYKQSYAKKYQILRSGDHSTITSGMITAWINECRKRYRLTVDIKQPKYSIHDEEFRQAVGSIFDPPPVYSEPKPESA